MFPTCETAHPCRVSKAPEPEWHVQPLPEARNGGGGSSSGRGGGLSGHQSDKEGHEIKGKAVSLEMERELQEDLLGSVLFPAVPPAPRVSGI